MYYERRIQFGFGGGLTEGVKTLLIANLIIFVIQLLSPGAVIETWLGLMPYLIVHQLYLWQLFTYMFLHANIWHIFFNMFVLWMFGGEIERVWGKRRFLKYYLICGIGAGAFYLLFNWGAHAVVIGASGAVFGILLAFAVLYPNRNVTFLLFFVLPINLKAKYLVMIFAGFNFLAALQSYKGSEPSTTAYLAHLGGLLVGYLYLRGGQNLEQVVTVYRTRRKQARLAAEARRQRDIYAKRKEVDRILDRINEVGFEGLSKREKKLLKEASEFLSQG